MAIDVWIAISYVMDFISGVSIFLALLLKTIAVNETNANLTASGLYYMIGHVKYFSDFVTDNIYFISNNTTMMRYSVGIWQKTAKNSTIIFGDWNATKGLSYIWRLGYQCIQPGYYCESKGPETVYWVLQFFKWLYGCVGRVGERVAFFYT